MLSLDDEGDFAWKCAWCGHASNVRHIVHVTKVEVGDYFTGRADWARKEFSWCNEACMNQWYGP